MNDKTKVRQQEIDAIRARAREDGVAKLAARLYADEPLLVAGVLRRQQRMERILRQAGVTEAVIDRVTREAYLMFLEPTLALDSAHRAMLHGLLPGNDVGGVDV